MSGDPRELGGQRHDNDDPQGWRGEIAGTPADGRVDVIVGDIHGSKPYRDAPYTPRPGAEGPGHPAPGDSALVIFDNDGKPWVVSWIGAA